MSVDLRLGRWQDVLADVEADALISDPPYSARTHDGADAGASTTSGTVTRANGRIEKKQYQRQLLTYSAWGEDDVNAFVDHWGPRTRGWFCVITDHVLAPIFAGAMALPENGGRYVFAPVPIVETGSRVRLTGDGPSSWTCYLVVGRPKREPYSKWGTLPGAYVGSGKGDREIIGGKDSEIMRRIVRDYSRPGDVVADPCAGMATTLVASVIEGRRAIGAEVDPATHARASARLARGFTPTLFADAPTFAQGGLDL